MRAHTESHRQRLIKRLRIRPNLVAAYVQAAIDSDDQAALLLALLTVVEARGGANT